MLLLTSACHGPALVGRPIMFLCSGPRPARPGPSSFFFMGCGPARPGPSVFYLMGRGPAGQAKFSEDGPRPDDGPCVARPGPARQFFQNMGCGLVQPIEFQITSARPGPAGPIEFSNLSAQLDPAHDIRSEAHETRASYGPARGFEEPAHGSAHGLAHVLPRTKKCTLMFLIFSY